MTESKSTIAQNASPARPETKPAAPGVAATAAPGSNAVTTTKRPILLAAFIIVVLLALSLGAAVWYQHQTFKQTAGDLQRRVQASAALAQQANSSAQQGATAAKAQANQIAALQRSLDESQDQLQSLEQAFQTLTDSGSDLVLVNDVDHLVTIADQQLSLSGNVANAVIALETAQAQLARANRPQLASLQQTINGDLDRLRAVSTIDVALLSSRLDELSTLVGRAPLLVPDDAAPSVAPSAGQPGAVAVPQSRAIDPSDPWWRRALARAENWSAAAWGSVRQDLGALIHVRRVNDPDALLMSPEQARQLRDNLQLRIMAAQLALMTRQPKIWTSEMQTIKQALGTRYDDHAPETQQALELARQLAGTSIKLELPTVTNSLQAIEALRQANAQSAERATMPSDTESDTEADTGSDTEADTPSDTGTDTGTNTATGTGTDRATDTKSAPSESTLPGEGAGHVAPAPTGQPQE